MIRSPDRPQSYAAAIPQVRLLNVNRAIGPGSRKAFPVSLKIAGMDKGLLKSGFRAAQVIAGAPIGNGDSPRAGALKKEGVAPKIDERQAVL